MKQVFWFSLILSLSSFFLGACSDGEHYAPVTDIASIEPLPKTGVHRVMPNETLYEIAWRYGLDYRYLAARNQISAPYTIHVGELIYVSGQAAKPVKTSPVMVVQKPTVGLSSSQVEKVEESKEAEEPNYSSAKWVWPAKGRTIDTFSVANKGVNIAGSLGEPIRAAAAGKVVYCGDGLRGYGNLIIIKHNSLYLSAYAHNRKLFVKEGEWVKQGQKIAEMGNTGTNKVMLHFEIRRAGKPINPNTLYR